MESPYAWKGADCLHENLRGVAMPDVNTVRPGPSGDPLATPQYNEYTVYDEAQVKIRYLVWVVLHP